MSDEQRIKELGNSVWAAVQATLQRRGEGVLEARDDVVRSLAAVIVSVGMPCESVRQQCEAADRIMRAVGFVNVLDN
jgi:hypothetical protein